MWLDPINVNSRNNKQYVKDHSENKVENKIKFVFHGKQIIEKYSSYLCSRIRRLQQSLSCPKPNKG